ncbi:hypothetical protein BLNAU_8624 [Blattamonas nauphoetae]|uniref:Uncharacterized protein n=1 Tax=Blattamonas nauphoetae TaxID=2049346 RepID=A0ABQ9XY32_9EUKA|nr:hypothetical protein BLNAU_8624 [Blattamonas nauphoetae]
MHPQLSRPSTSRLTSKCFLLIHSTNTQPLRLAWKYHLELPHLCLKVGMASLIHQFFRLTCPPLVFRCHSRQKGTIVHLRIPLLMNSPHTANHQPRERVPYPKLRQSFRRYLSCQKLLRAFDPFNDNMRNRKQSS